MARLAENMYMGLPDASQYNIIYHKLNGSEALLLADRISQAENKCKEALAIAKALKDSNVNSDVYQDMATIAKQQKDFKKALEYSMASYKKLYVL